MKIHPLVSAKACALVFAAFIFNGCAGPYRTLNPAALPYQNKAVVKDAMEVSYLYDVQGLSRNKRYSKKEKKFGYAAIGVRVKNVSDQPIVLSEDNFHILANDNVKLSVPAEKYARVVRQTSATYLLHTLWGPWSYSWEEKNSSTGRRRSEFKFLPIGAAVGVVNLIIAETANNDHYKTLKKNELYGKVIEPGQTAYGIVILPLLSYEPLSFQWMDQ